MTAGEPHNCTEQVRNAGLGKVSQRRDFLRARNGARSHGRAFVLQGFDRADGNLQTRFGYTVTKKTGNSVARNRIRRRLREAVRNLHAEAKITDKLAGYDVIIIARKEAADQPFAELQQALAKAFHQLVANSRPRGQKRPASRQRPSVNANDKRDLNQTGGR